MESLRDLALELLNKYQQAKGMQIAHSSRNPEKDEAELNEEVKAYEDKINQLTDEE